MTGTKILTTPARHSLLPVSLAFAILAAGCGNDPAPLSPAASLSDPDVTVAVGDTFKLKVGHAARIEDAGFTVRLDSVFDDQRCPVRSLVQCIWEGEVKLAFTVAEGENSTTALMSRMGPGPADAFTVGNHSVRMTRLLPDLEIDQVVPQGEYTGTFISE